MRSCCARRASSASRVASICLYVSSTSCGVGPGGAAGAFFLGAMVKLLPAFTFACCSALKECVYVRAGVGREINLTVSLDKPLL